jgi:hypothetical protein
MSSAPIVAAPSLRSTEEARAESLTRSWAVACVLGASLSVALGAHWDIAWHRSIGRDAFWSPPHVLIYLAAVMAGGAAAVMILGATFGAGRAARDSSVGVLGFRGPLGAFVCAWGGGTMLVSAPFDDWWHNAYGLDVKILSPPHVLLATGILGIHIGALIFVLAERNVADGARRRALETLFLGVGGMVLVALTTVIMERTSRIWMHESSLYQAVALAVPAVLAAVGTASERRWAATAIASTYSLFICALIWVLPLFSAEPKLGPVLTPVTHFIPPEFPLLLVVPALALDGVRPWLARRRRRTRAAAMGALFTITFVPAQWAFATFLMSPLARNRFFGTIYFDYRTPVDGLYRRWLFMPRQHGSIGGLALGLLVALLLAVLTTWLGLAFGEWMRRVRR